MKFGSLFSGIGGLDLGLERAGLECRWQVELDEFCRKVLARQWPEVTIHDDIETFETDKAEKVALIAGGFPCQDISHAGQGKGIEGKRSGLFHELMRIVRAMGPRYVLLENVTALTTRGIDTVLGELAKCGYDAEWEVLSASQFGAPHVRKRIFILAYDQSVGREKGRLLRRAPPTLPDVGKRTQYAHWRAAGHWLENEPRMARMVHGNAIWVDRIGALGNAVVPQVAEWIGRQIMRD